MLETQYVLSILLARRSFSRLQILLRLARGLMRLSLVARLGQVPLLGRATLLGVVALLKLGTVLESPVRRWLQIWLIGMMLETLHILPLRLVLRSFFLLRILR